MLKKIFLSLLTLSAVCFSPLFAQEEMDSTSMAQPVEASTQGGEELEVSSNINPSTDLIDRFTPHSVSSEINSKYHEINPILSPDGNTLYFIRANHPENYYGEDSSQDIWYSELQEDGSWSTAKRLDSEFNKGRYNSILSISDDGKHFLVSGKYSKKGGKRIKRGLSIVYKDGGEWSIPLEVSVPKVRRKNKGVSSNAYLDNKETIMFLNYTRKWEGEKLDIFYSLAKKKSKYKSPKKMKRNVRKPFASMETPYFDLSDSTLYFSACKKGRENKYQYDFYKTSPLDAELKNWSDPIKLSDTLNFNDWNSYFRKIKEGYWAIFSTSKEDNSDIYWVKLKEKFPFVELSGVVKNGYNNEPFTKPFKFIVDDVVVDSVNVDETGAYSIRLPLGSKYEIQTEAEYYTATPVVVDVTGRREFMELEKDLILTPIPYVTLSASIFNSKDKAIIGEGKLPRIAINGEIIDSIAIKDGKFQVNLPWGQKYNLQVVVKDFEPRPVSIDLTKITEFQSLSAKLYATPLEKFAILTGKVINKKTDKPLTSAFAINVDDAKSIMSTIDTINGTYEIRLALGRQTILTAGAHKFFPISEIIDLTAETGNVKIIKDLYLSPLVIGEHILLNNIFFEHGKDVLKPESFKDIDRVVDLLKDYKNMKIEIGGHTDNKGHDSYNQRLSEKRAKAVTKYIISKGVSEDRIIAKGYGETKPIASNRRSKGRSKNRRVEFTVLEQ